MSKKRKPNYVIKNESVNEDDTLELEILEESKQEPLMEKVKVVNTNNVNLREGPSKNEKVILLIGGGAVFYLLKKLEDWSFVEQIDGLKKKGYIMNQYLEKVK